MSSMTEKYQDLRSRNGKPMCYAPLASLRFTNAGIIQVCCFNRFYSLGKYPDTGIREAWTGDRRKKIISALEQGDFSMGCGYCKAGISQGLFSSAGAAQYDYLDKMQAVNRDWPVMIDFELGNECNLECIMCNGENSALIRKNRENMPGHAVPFDDAFIDQVCEFIPHLREARFVGGEPFLIQLNYKLWEKIIEINPACRITVLTNGTILNDKIRHLLNRGNFAVSVSADGIHKATYEKIRRNADFDVFQKNLREFRQFASDRKQPFFFNFCPMTYNWQEIPEVFEFCNRNKMNIVLHTVHFPPHAALWTLSAPELRKIHQHLTVHKPRFSAFSKVQKDNKKKYGELMIQIENWQRMSSSSEDPGNDIPSLKADLYRKIEDYINRSEIFASTDKEAIILSYKSRLDTIFGTMNAELEHKTLKFLNTFNLEFILAELENSDVEKIRERLNTAAQA